MPAELTLDDVSVLLVWTAIAVYVLAFVAYAVDLARRSALNVERQDTAVRARELVGVGAGSSETIAQVRASEEAAEASLMARGSARVRPVWARIGTAMMWLAFLFHLGATVTRGIAAERVPWSNMYEFSMTGTLLVSAVYLTVLFRYDLRFLGSFISGLVVLLLGGSTVGFWTEVAPLSDPLKSIWLVVHVFVASLSMALFALAFALSVLQLMQIRRERKAAASEAGASTGPGFLRILPSAEAMESLAYRFAIVGFIFWTFTLIAGAIWANDAWGRYWGFDTKEVWTFVIWVLYAGYIHARATRGWRGVRSAWLSIIGFSAIIFNYTIVNMFFQGLHAYSGLN